MMRVCVFSHIRLFSDALAAYLDSCNEISQVMACHRADHLVNEVLSFFPDIVLIEKRDIYRRFLTAWSHVLQCPDADRARAEAELKMAKHELLLWGNSGVLRAYSAVQELREVPHSHAERGAFEKVLKAIRMDCRQQTIGLKSGDLLALWLSRADSELKEKAGGNSVSNT